MIFPMAVASAGPEKTGRLVASAVNWQSLSLRLPPPMTWILSIDFPVRRRRRSRVQRYFKARLSKIQRTVAAKVGGGPCPVRRQKLRLASVMFGGLRKSGQSGAIKAPKGEALPV